MSRIGVMGGSFDPIHNGHLALAEKAALQFELDKVLFVTSGNPPHKKGRVLLDAQMRHKMVSIAIENYNKFEPCDFEVNREAYSYTVDTLQYLKKQNKDAELFLIIGADSFHDLRKWHKPRTICELCTLLVYPREGYDIEKDLEEIKKEYYCRAEIIKAGNIDISSTMLRKLLKKRQNVAGLVPRKVLKVIVRNDFYTSDYGPIESRVKARLKPERYKHSTNVAAKAVELAKRYGVDTKKAYLAGIVHDCAKNMSLEQMRMKCVDYDIELDEFEQKNPGLMHAKVGERVAQIELGIRDKEVLAAVKWHTLGHPGMGDLEKIIFVADMIEDGRSFTGVDELRRTAFENLDDGVEACIKATINFNTTHNREIHPMAYEVLKWLEEKKAAEAAEPERETAVDRQCSEE